MLSHFYIVVFIDAMKEWQNPLVNVIQKRRRRRRWRKII